MTQEIIEKPMSAECTMKQYEAIPDADFVENREYQLTDYPDNGANAEQMAYALTCKRLFPAGTVVTFSGTTDTNYTNGHLYQIQVDTSGTKNWKDITPVSEQSIPIITGTQEKPINLATDLEFGKYYILRGYIYHGGGTAPIIYNTNILCKTGKRNDVAGVATLMNYTYSSNKTVFYSFYISGTTDIGWIFESTTLINQIRLNATDYVSEVVEVYAPTTSGAAGQILQSNGAYKAPTWVDNTAPFVLDVTNLTTKISDANLTQLQNNKIAYIRYTQTTDDGIGNLINDVFLYRKVYTLDTESFNVDETPNLTFALAYDSIGNISKTSKYLKVYTTEGPSGVGIEKGDIKEVAQNSLITPTGTPTNGQVPIIQAGKLVWGNVSTSGQIKTVTYDNTTLGDHIADILSRVNVENGGTLLSIGFKTGTASVAASATKTTITNGANPTVATSSEAVLKPATFYSFRSADINKTGNVTMLTLNGPNGLIGCSSTNIEITSDSSTETPTNTCVADGCGQNINADGAVEIITFKGVNLLSIPLEHLVIDYFVV